MRKYLGLILIFGLFTACEKVNYYPDNKLEPLRIAMVHRGGRTSVMRENTLEGCKKALAHAKNGGIEIDIQISKDRTIWLSHSERVISCNGDIGCFAETRDSVIAAIDSCAGKSIKYTRLEELIAWMANNCPEKYLNVDLKGWMPCAVTSLGIEGLMRLEAELVIALGDKYNFTQQMLLETDAATVLVWAQKKSNKIKTHLNVYGDLERGMLMALQYNFNGISFKCNLEDELTKDYLHLYHKKGLRVVAWNLRDTNQMHTLFDMGVDYCEYDLPE